MLNPAAAVAAAAAARHAVSTDDGAAAAAFIAGKIRYRYSANPFNPVVAFAEGPDS